MTRRKLAAASVLLAIVTAACGSGKPAASPSPSVSVPTQAATSRMFPVVRESFDVDVAAPSADKRKPACPGIQYRYPRNIDPSKSFIIALVDPYRGYGPECPVLRRGSTCRVPFQGSWRLEETPLGSVVFEIFENDSPDPMHTVEFGPIGPRGNFSRSLSVLYKVGPKADYATFRALLRDASGAYVAESPPQTVPIPSCVD